jgi:hypothetical protein
MAEWRREPETSPEISRSSESSYSDLQDLSSAGGASLLVVGL